MREKLLHANLVSLLLKIHVDQEVLRVLVSIRSLEHHFDIVDRAHISLANVYDYARVLVLYQDHFVCFALRLECDVWLRDH